MSDDSPTVLQPGRYEGLETSGPVKLLAGTYVFKDCRLAGIFYDEETVIDVAGGDGKLYRIFDRRGRDRMSDERIETVADLIACLERIEDKSATIGVKAACCGHCHDFVVRRLRPGDDGYGEVEIALESH